MASSQMSYIAGVPLVCNALPIYSTDDDPKDGTLTIVVPYRMVELLSSNECTDAEKCELIQFTRNKQMSGYHVWCHLGFISQAFVDDYSYEETTCPDCKRVLLFYSKRTCVFETTFGNSLIGISPSPSYTDISALIWPDAMVRDTTWAVDVAGRPTPGVFRACMGTECSLRTMARSIVSSFQPLTFSDFQSGLSLCFEPTADVSITHFEGLFFLCNMMSDSAINQGLVRTGFLDYIVSNISCVSGHECLALILRILGVLFHASNISIWESLTLNMDFIFDEVIYVLRHTDSPHVLVESSLLVLAIVKCVDIMTFSSLYTKALTALVSQCDLSTSHGLVVYRKTIATLSFASSLTCTKLLVETESIWLPICMTMFVASNHATSDLFQLCTLETSDFLSSVLSHTRKTLVSWFNHLTHVHNGNCSDFVNDVSMSIVAELVLLDLPSMPISLQTALFEFHSELFMYPTELFVSVEAHSPACQLLYSSEVTSFGSYFSAYLSSLSNYGSILSNMSRCLSLHIGSCLMSSFDCVREVVSPQLPGSIVSLRSCFEGCTRSNSKMFTKGFGRCVRATMKFPINSQYLLFQSGFISYMFFWLRSNAWVLNELPPKLKEFLWFFTTYLFEKAHTWESFTCDDMKFSSSVVELFKFLPFIMDKLDESINSDLLKSLFYWCSTWEGKEEWFNSFYYVLSKRNPDELCIQCLKVEIENLAFLIHHRFSISQKAQMTALLNVLGVCIPGKSTIVKSYITPTQFNQHEGLRSIPSPKVRSKRLIPNKRKSSKRKLNDKPVKSCFPVGKPKHGPSGTLSSSTVWTDLSIIEIVLGWNPADIATNVAEQISLMSSEIPIAFKSSQEYRSVFFPMLVEETRASIEDTLTSLTVKSTFHKLKVLANTFNGTYVATDFQVSSHNGSSIEDIHVSSILILFNSEPTQDIQTVLKGSAFGVVESRRLSKNTIRVSLINLNKFSTLKGAVVYCASLVSLVPLQREILALKGLSSMPLLPHIMCPTVASDITTQSIALDGLNPSQMTAMLQATSTKCGFSLIQGPPGTGKTKTIVSIVHRFLEIQSDRNQENIGSSSGWRTRYRDETLHGKHILVCAPSNAAVDELCSRLSELLPASTEDPSFLLRFGSRVPTTSPAYPHSLSRILRQHDCSLDNDSSDISLLPSLKADLAIISGTIRNTLNEDDLQRALTRKRNITKQLISISTSSRLSKDELFEKRHALEVKLLSGARIVCTTLSGSGHPIFNSISHGFDTVIIDESAQCVEPSSLIPLRLKCKRCILVGDPQQLSSTVRSRNAVRLGFSRSLFERLQCGLTPQLLTTQYRMHPDISSFPSRYFYDGLLTNAPSVCNSSYVDSELPPYMFYNLTYSREERIGNSISNPEEANFAVSLCCYIRDKTRFQNMTIGIITPYKGQVTEISKIISSRRLSDIRASTVDSFQGQELDFVIFSCVRSNTQGSDHGIGFLSNAKRLNVALTRARLGMYIVGSESTVSKNTIWKSLLDDAKKRNLLTTVRSGSSIFKF